MKNFHLNVCFFACLFFWPLCLGIASFVRERNSVEIGRYKLIGLVPFILDVEVYWNVIMNLKTVDTEKVKTQGSFTIANLDS